MISVFGSSSRLTAVVGGALRSLLLLTSAALLLALWMRAQAPPWWALQWIASSRFADAIVSPVVAMAALLVASVLLFVPLGVLTAWIMRRTRWHWAARDAVSVALGGGVLLLAWWLAERLPWLLWLAPAMPGVLLGVAIAPALWPFAPWRALRRAAIGGVVVLGLLLAVAGALLSPSYPFAASPLPAVDRAALLARLGALDPRELVPQERAALVLSADDLAVLLLAGARRLDSAARVRVVPLHERAALVISVAVDVGIPGRGILALDAELAVRLGEQVHGAAQCHVQVGALTIDGAMCRELLFGWVRALGRSPAQPAARRQVAELDLLRIDAAGLALVYHRPVIDEASRAFLRELLGPPAVVVVALDAQLRNFTQHALPLSRSTRRFEDALRVAFRLAELRSRVGDPILENQGAVLALAMLFGDPQVALAAGLPRDARIAGIAERVGPVALYGRVDWAQHFLVSAALAHVATAAGSDTVGTWKEQLDARGDSGFSFTDLLVDRAGTRFGQRLVASEAGAHELQRWLAAGAPEAAIVPSPVGLPEGLDRGTFEARFGAVGSPAYRAMEARIEARLAALSLYRDGA